MTIDEAIENLKYDFEIDMYIRDIAPQLAEWLEELKNNRIALEKANGYLEVNHKLGYSKAIDDFLEKIQWEYLNGCGIKQSEIDFLIAVSSRVAEQLKAGGEDEAT